MKVTGGGGPDDVRRASQVKRLKEAKPTTPPAMVSGPSSIDSIDYSRVDERIASEAATVQDTPTTCHSRLKAEDVDESVNVGLRDSVPQTVALLSGKLCECVSQSGRLAKCADGGLKHAGE